MKTRGLAENADKSVILSIQGREKTAHAEPNFPCWQIKFRKGLKTPQKDSSCKRNKSSLKGPLGGIYST